MEPQQKCPHCEQVISQLDYFCPSCGKKLKGKPLSVSVGRQIFVYLLSVLLPPLGLWPAVRYLKQNSEKSRMIGFIAIALTIISIVVTVWFSIGYMNVFNQQLKQQLNNNINLYR